MSGLVQWPQGFEKVSCSASQLVPRKGQLNPTKFALRNFAEQMLANDLILNYLILIRHLIKLVAGKYRAVLADVLFANVAASALAHAALHAQL